MVYGEYCTDFTVSLFGYLDYDLTYTFFLDSFFIDLVSTEDGSAARPVGEKCAGLRVSNDMRYPSTI